MKHSLFTRLLSLFLAMALLVPCFPQVTAEELTDIVTEETEAVETTDATEETEATDEATEATEATEAPTVAPPQTDVPKPETTVPEETEAAEETEATEATEATEPTEVTEAAGETEESLLPYGLAGLPEGYVLGDVHADYREKMEEHDFLSTLGTVEAGYDYVADEILVPAASEEEAQIFAAAYNGQLISWEYDLAVIQLDGLDPAQAVALAMDETMNMPAASLNNLYHVDPIFSDGSNSTVYAADPPQKETWESYVGSMSNPDPYLKKPTDSNYQYMHDVVGSYAAWGLNTGRSAIKVAVIDSGVAPHPDLKFEAVSVGQGTGDPDGHGTHVAGIIAATLNNGIGGAGIAPNVKLYGYRTADSDGDLVTSAIISAINNAAKVKDVDLINMSLGGSLYNYSFDSAVQTAVSYGTTVVVAMGNDGSNAKQYPAGYDNVIAVGATGRDNGRAYFSNFGPWCDVAAPGVDVMSTYLNSSYVLMDGTSMATPVVTGVCALYMSIVGRVSPAEMEKALKAGCTKISEKNLGAGIVNLAKMLGGKPEAPAYTISGSSTSFSGNYKNQVVSYDSAVSLYPQENDNTNFIVYTLDGKNPSVKNGEVAYGNVYSGMISLTPYAGSTVTLKAMQVSGMGIPGSVLTLKIKVGQTASASSVTILGPSKLAAGKSVDLKAIVYPEATADQTVTWSLGRSTVYGVSINAKTGRLTASRDAFGSARIFATADNGTFDEFSVEIGSFSPVAKMALNESKYNLFRNQSLTLYVDSMTDSKGNDIDPRDTGILWTSSNPKVATVDQSGRVKALTKGSATITAKALDGSNKSAKCSVKVIQQVTDVVITGDTAMAPGKSTTLKATTLPLDAGNKKVVWSIQSSTVYGAEINEKNGKLTVPKYASTGTVTVKATATDGMGASRTYTVAVKSRATAVSITLESYSGWAKGGTFSKGNLKTLEIFSANLPNSSGADNRASLGVKVSGSDSSSILWTSSKPSVASVDQSGNVTGHAAGTAKITATAQDGSKKKATVTVKVGNPVSYMAINSAAPQMSIPYPVIAFGKSVKNTVNFGETYGKPSNTKVTWDFQVYKVELTSGNWSSLTKRTNITSTMKSQKLVSISNGTLKISSKLYDKWNSTSYLPYGQEFMVTVTARSTDGTAVSTSQDYILIPATKTVKPNSSNYKLNSYSGYKLYFTTNQWRMLGYNIAVFDVVSSNPDVCSADTVGYSDGKAYVHVATGKPGTATLTLRATDGSNKKCTFKVTVR